MTITSKNYVENVLRTNCIYDKDLIARLVSCSQLLHAAIGIATESGELLDMLKKHIFQNKPLDKVNAKEELGDLEWYISLALDDIKTSMDEVLTLNIKKLKLRYPEKFSEEKAINRNVEAERELLEKPISELNADINEENWVKQSFIYDKENSHLPDCERPEYQAGKITWDKASKTNPKPFPNFDTISIEEFRNALQFTEPKNYSQRGLDWIKFATKVLTHIEEYTVKQYGDKGEDQITEWSIGDCLKAVNKRVARYGRQSREGQQKLDFLKMAHEVQIAYEKYHEMLFTQAEQELRDDANQAH